MSRTLPRHDNTNRKAALVSISIGVVYYTALTKRYALIYALNSFLRKLGWAPRPPGDCIQPIESLKYYGGWIATRLLERMGRFHRQRGM